MKTKELLKLADALEHDVPVGQFNIDLWVTSNDCGFAGCAIGWGNELKILPSTLTINDTGDPVFNDYGGIIKRFGFDAIATAYGLTPEQAEYLFGGTYYDGRYEVTPSVVADRIRKFVVSPSLADEYVNSTLTFG